MKEVVAYLLFARGVIPQPLDELLKLKQRLQEQIDSSKLKLAAVAATPGYQSEKGDEKAPSFSSPFDMIPELTLAVSANKTSAVDDKKCLTQLRPEFEKLSLSRNENTSLRGAAPSRLPSEKPNTLNFDVDVDDMLGVDEDFTFGDIFESSHDAKEDELVTPSIDTQNTLRPPLGTQSYNAEIGLHTFHFSPPSAPQPVPISPMERPSSTAPRRETPRERVKRGRITRRLRHVSATIDGCLHLLHSIEAFTATSSVNAIHFILRSPSREVHELVSISLPHTSYSYAGGPVNADRAVDEAMELYKTICTARREENKNELGTKEETLDDDDIRTHYREMTEEALDVPRVDGTECDAEFYDIVSGKTPRYWRSTSPTIRYVVTMIRYVCR